jgi:hypothetical protein
VGAAVGIAVGLAEGGREIVGKVEGAEVGFGLDL